MLVSRRVSMHVFSRSIATLFGVVLLFAVSATAQYTRTNLTGDTQGEGNFIDPHLKNAWGLVTVRASLTGTFWIADQATGLATVYLSTGQPLGTVVSIPPASGNGPGAPAGLVTNSTPSFKITEGTHTAPAMFLFSTLDGTISGYNPAVDSTHAIIAVNKGNTGALYAGLAIAHTNSGDFIYAANASANTVDMYDGNFNLVKSFTDKNIPPGFSPYGIQVIGQTLYVAYATALAFPGTAAAGGFVDTFDLTGDSPKTLINDSNLNQPWGIALAPPNFGPLSSTLLIANLGNGLINGFNPVTGTFVGSLKQNGTPITIDGLWGITFISSPALSPPSKLYFAAGPGGYIHGQFGVITVN
jgi:uncharacterized protein (TIGR03118 family)